MKMDGKKKMVLAALLALLVLAMVAATQFWPGTGLFWLGGEEKAGPELERQLRPNPDRAAYGMGTFIGEGRQPISRPIKEAFSKLPAMPKDFGDKMYFIKEGNFAEETLSLEEAYYKQPEFLPRFEEIGLKYWKSPDLKRWGKEGFGIFPWEQGIEIKPGEKVYITAFLHSAYGIETFQGLRLRPVFGGEEMERHFKVWVEPENFLLGPSYPEMDANWMQKLVIGVEAGESLKKGNYSIGFEAMEPEAELGEYWAGKYGHLYVAGPGMSGTGKPRLVVYIRMD